MISRTTQIVKILFRRVSIERLLSFGMEQQLFYEINKEYLKGLMLTSKYEFSDTEVEAQIREVRSEMRKIRFGQETGDGINAFAVLFFCVKEILTFYENHVVCQYRYLLDWNALTRDIGEDLPVVALITMEGEAYINARGDFYWPPVIKHNNGQLNRILDKGLADNHFHLRCAAPYFEVSWINLMNNPGRVDTLQFFVQMESNYRDKDKKAEINVTKRSLRNLVMCAALIRLYLFSRITDIPIHFSEYFISPEEADSEFRAAGREVEENKANEGSIGHKREYVNLRQLKGRIPDERYRMLYQRETWTAVKRILAGQYEILAEIAGIQSNIDSLQMLSHDVDYLLKYMRGNCFEGESEYKILSGERWFIYQIMNSMQRHVNNESCMFSRDEYNLFFAYLRIKNELRHELIQTNGVVGLENFQIYQSRKDYFSHINNWEEGEKRLARLAVRGVLSNSPVQYLEVRISPDMSAERNAENIRKYDEAICHGISKEDIFEDMMKNLQASPWVLRGQKHTGVMPHKYYYIFHFNKKADTPLEKFGPLTSRHYQLRQQIAQKTEAILLLRRDYPEYGKRVIAIDACSQEIGCRPEVFACSFRLLKNYVTPFPTGIETLELPQLKISYHVGEDFLDITDGLRAIDEAIRFLNLDCGDRLGHALALGIDVRKWYAVKGNHITISLQDFLDNVVWLHHVLNKYNIKDMSPLKGWLEEMYSYYFNYIYQGCAGILNSNNHHQNREEYTGNLDLNTYYYAWLLRGDDPQIYKDCGYDKSIDFGKQGDKYVVNVAHMRTEDIRKIPEVTLIYYMYHYDRNVRYRGSEEKTIALPPYYIDGVAAIQKEMQEEIVRRGLAIETMPSSNVNISIMENYNEHPIRVFYNMGLTMNEFELLECPQINVSINTDNNGTFATRLENEYALLACAMEQIKLENGKPKYKREAIYNWLDNIRKMGLRQAFAKERKDYEIYVSDI